MVQLATKAAMAPTAAHTGMRATPTTPTVRGISIRVLPSEFLMMIRRALPSLTSSLTLVTSFSPEIVNSSVLGVDLVREVLVVLEDLVGIGFG